MILSTPRAESVVLSKPNYYGCGFVMCVCGVYITCVNLKINTIIITTSRFSFYGDCMKGR